MSAVIAAFMAAASLVMAVPGPTATVAETAGQMIEAKLAKPEHEVIYTEYGVIEIAKSDIELCAKLVWGEARGVKSDAEKAAVIWCALNRLDDGSWGDTLYGVVTYPSQFTGYRRSNPVTEELYALALDVLLRYEKEKRGDTDSGRTLPEEYRFFVGYSGRNWFRKTYRDPGPRWDWSLPDPYAA